MRLLCISQLDTIHSHILFVFVYPLYIPWFLVYKVCDTMIVWYYSLTDFILFVYPLYIHSFLVYKVCVFRFSIHMAQCPLCEYMRLFLVPLCFICNKSEVDMIIGKGWKVHCDFVDSLYYTPANHGLTWGGGINYYLISHGWISFCFGK